MIRDSRCPGFRRDTESRNKTEMSSEKFTDTCRTFTGRVGSKGLPLLPLSFLLEAKMNGNLKTW